MPATAKLLFRPEALAPKLAAFSFPPRVAMARPKIAHWAKLLGTAEADRLKESELLREFITDVFVDLLGHTGPACGADRYTLKREATVEVEGKFADAAIGEFFVSGGEPTFVAALEGKGPRDPLDRPFAGRKLSAVDQALRYAVNLVCDWYLVTNLREIRLYHKGHDQFTFERFETVAIASNEAVLRRFVFLLGAERLVASPAHCHLDELLSESRRIRLDLTREYYHEFARLRCQTFEELWDHNPQVAPADLLTSTQKMLDRVLFISFSQDRGLLPEESIAKAYSHADPYNPRPIWDNFQGLFRAVDQGNARLGIERYNGGLFARDELLDRLNVPNAACKGFDRLAAYDYRLPTAVEDGGRGKAQLIDVEILGHIFEQSITHLEEMRNGIANGQTVNIPDAGLSKRKREGAFYTPSFITRYIVAATLGPVLKDRFEALRRQHYERTATNLRKVLDDPSAYDIDQLRPGQRKALELFWDAWLAELTTLRIVDIGCGSGAFLIEAFDQLYTSYQQAQARYRELHGPTLFDTDRQILQNNLYGVDVNSEAVEICRLSLWIKTAQAGKELTSLDHQVRVGNSVVADPTVHPLAFDWRSAFPEVFAAGGFDVVIGNPPYVRQEWISPYKPHFQQHYRAYDGAADLYVYFYERGIDLLKPGGRLGFVVTNKWMKAGYGEPLRRFFAEHAWVESVVDFGHAKQIFEEADVFPSILVARKPTVDPPPAGVRVCAIPREQLRVDDLERQIAAEGFEVPRVRLGADSWTLERPDVVALMEKIRRVGVPLKEVAGVEPLRGILTGYNEAFLLDTPTKEQLVKADPNSAGLFRPYFRGQDIDRWRAEGSGLWMLAMKSSSNHPWPWSEVGDRAEAVFAATYPALHVHMSRHRDALTRRQDQGEHWWELRSCAYWDKFDQPKVMYQEIQFHPCYLLDQTRTLCNNKVYFLPSGDKFLLGVLNSPLLWWHNWRYLPHMKDDALTPVSFLFEDLPVARPSEEQRAGIAGRVERLIVIAAEVQASQRAVLDWLRLEFEVEKPSQKLQGVIGLDAVQLATEVKKARGSKKPMSVAQVSRLKGEHAESVVPLQTLAVEAQQLERRVADLVHAAYGLTAEEVALMWRTAPPRMPFGPALG